MTSKKSKKATDDEVPTEIEVPTDWAESMFVQGRLQLTPEHLDAMEGKSTIRLPVELTASIFGPPSSKAPIEWMAPLDAVHWLAPQVGGDAKAKALIAERLRDGAVMCANLWLSEGPDVGPLTTMRPKISDDPRIQNRAFWVTPMNRNQNLPQLGGLIWDYTDDWERDVKRWNWASGLIVTSREVALSDGSTGEAAKVKIGFSATRMVAASVRFNRADIAKIARAPERNRPEKSYPENIHSTQAEKSFENRGRPRSEKWNDWIAEVIVFSHTDDIDPEMPADKFYDLIAARLERRKVACPEYTTVEKAISSIKIRWREAKNSGEC